MSLKKAKKNSTSIEQNTETRVWYDSDMKKISEQDALSWIFTAYNKNKLDNAKLVLGTDSHLHGKNFRFVSGVCVYTPGKGGNFVMCYDYENRTQYKGNQKARMFREVEKSIELGNFLFEKLNLIPSIHIDASPEGAGEFTSSFSEQLKGYAVGSGFDSCLKPDSWVASALADRFTK
jgi:predicted RNase H-related nuclease YkuK (DUF458 family)